ncbi:MAG: CTP synthase [Candidatus Paceibacterota bacterium]
MARAKNHKYIFVVGGVMSGVGKGVATSSLSKVLQSKGFKVNPIKVDPYLNVDAGTMNPTEHGEVFVLDSGLETDQDMGNYERFLNKDLRSENYITSGMVYWDVLKRERNLGYKGKCVEAIPHIRDDIIARIEKSADVNGSEISVIEIGGTIGDYQNALFMEAARVLRIKNPNNVLFVMVSYLPIPGSLSEMKTRPTQNAVRQLNSYGIQPDIIIARAPKELDKKRKEKIALSCNVEVRHVISAPDIKSIYDVPLNFEKDELADMVLKELKLRSKKTDIKEWEGFVNRLGRARKEVSIAIVGKYFDTGDYVLSDSYLSVIEAIKFSAAELGLRVDIEWLNAKEFENGGSKKVHSLKKYNGIIVPGGFGESGSAGKLKVIRYAREKKIPYFGLCYGMQLAVVEYARNALGMRGANTVEIDSEARHPVIDIIDEQKEKLEKEEYGGTMRLGAYPAHLHSGSIAHAAYGTNKISERHRHRFEVNMKYMVKLVEGGLIFSGVSPNRMLMEIMELPKKVHPFFLGTQFHPEFKARPLAPHPLFTAFLKAAVRRKK